ncbi:MAG: DUF2188 domain-containing protein [Vulcanimicrobiota bacterium]
MKARPSPASRLIQTWLEVCRHAICRQVEGGILAHSLRAPENCSHLAVLLEKDKQGQLESEARRLLGQDFVLRGVHLDLESPLEENEQMLSLRQILIELQQTLLEPENRPFTQDAELLSFLLREAKFKSPLVPLRRVVYHVAPHDGRWKLTRRGSDEATIFERKEDAVQEGARIARTHPESQLLIHLANGRFEEERTYGSDHRRTPG